MYENLVIAPPPPHTGNCSAPGHLYRNNFTLQDDRFNLAYWNNDNEVGFGTNATNGRPGYLWGGAPNSWFVRDPDAAAASGLTALRSIILVTEGGEHDGILCHTVAAILGM